MSMKNHKRDRSDRLFVSTSVAAALTGLCVLATIPLFAQGTNDTTTHMLRPVIVTGKAPNIHDVESESDLVGPANQPEWTTRRAFAETDIYVIPPGEFEFNQFYVSSHPRHGKPENLFESEFEFGLPWRTQFDVELNYSLVNGRLQHDATLVELPHALADWGKIPLNPTIDAGWLFNHRGADSYFFRLLLADELSERFHFGSNLSFQRQIGDERETAYELNTALTYVAINSKLALGGEFLFEYETAREDGEFEDSTTAMLGPTLLFKPTHTTHLGLVTLFGLTKDSPVAEVILIFGMDL